MCTVYIYGIEKWCTVVWMGNHIVTTILRKGKNNKMKNRRTFYWKYEAFLIRCLHTTIHLKCSPCMGLLVFVFVCVIWMQIEYIYVIHVLTLWTVVRNALLKFQNWKTEIIFFFFFTELMETIVPFWIWCNCNAN